MLGRKAFPFQTVNLFLQNCIGSLVGEREVISGFVDHEFKEILILSLLSCSSSTPKTHFSSYRSSPAFAHLCYPSPYLVHFCFSYACSEVHRAQAVVHCHTVMFFIFFFFSLEFLTLHGPSPLLSTELVLTDHLHSQQYQKIFSKAIALPEGIIMSLLLGMCISWCALLYVYHQWFHLPSSRSPIITSSLHDTSQLLLFLQP